MKEEVRLKLNSFFSVQLQEEDVISIWITELKPSTLQRTGLFVECATGESCVGGCYTHFLWNQSFFFFFCVVLNLELIVLQNDGNTMSFVVSSQPNPPAKCPKEDSNM
jgi:hypothetical protein